MLNLTCVVDHETLSPGLKGEHGLSFWIESGDRVILFDTGQTGDVLLNNLAALHLQPDRINAVVLSHGHYDHTGGLQALLQKQPDLPVYANGDLFQPRFSNKKGEYQSIGVVLNQKSLKTQPRFLLSNEAVEVFANVWTTGEILQKEEETGSSPHHFIRAEGEGWLPDPYRDDLSLVYQGNSGLTLICGCCHAGLLNTLAHVEKLFRRRVVNVVGGIHLMPASNVKIDHVINVLRGKYPDETYHLNHCTGSNAVNAFHKAFPGRVDYLKAGMSIVFD